MTSLRASTILLINKDLLAKVTTRYPGLNKEVSKVAKWIVIERAPLCDFFIDHELLVEVKNHAQELHRKKTFHKQVQSNVFDMTH